MTKIKFLHSVLLLCGWLFVDFSVMAQSDYVLGAGDQVQIKVYGHSDLTSTTTLGSDGKFTFQFVGEMQAAGLTSNLLAEKVRDGLKGDYLINPLVSVDILKYRNFYIQGEVENPGGYPFEPGINISKALALAGGLTDRGSKEKIELISQSVDEKTSRLAAMSTVVDAGDIIVVGQRFF